eukprot:c19678_g1_i1.p1 GENE.c19678_g1_i1~~c19678_g1_i1.p1  ORF type:complete len:498 (-),score=212.74 c19678_g1_i1:37-1323(-)
MLIALRLNVFAKGNSGIRPETVSQVLAAFNADCLPVVPEQGTVGASGDLAPLSHLALGFMGEGKMWDPQTKEQGDSAVILAKHGLKPIQLQAKEGLAMINGTTLISALASEALVRAMNIAQQANVVAALTLESLRGTVSAMDPRIHAARPHNGQVRTAAMLRSILHREGNLSAISVSHENCGKVQDSYTLRCIPQVHGICWDTLLFVQRILEVELNSATDNPMVFTDEGEGLNLEDSKKNITLSGGNFHGEYPAKACDYLAIGVHELASISERRIERLVNPALSHGLPAFLIKDGGLNSGFMIAHCTAAALVSENKGLCHPASIDSISTSAAQEDHVSMGGWAARKALRVVEHVEFVVAIELLCACQAIDFLRPLTSTPALESVHSLVRSKIPHVDRDRVLADDIQKAAEMLRKNEIIKAVSKFSSSL